MTVDVISLPFKKVESRAKHRAHCDAPDVRRIISFSTLSKSKLTLSALRTNVTYRINLQQLLSAFCFVLRLLPVTIGSFFNHGASFFLCIHSRVEFFISSDLFVLKGEMLSRERDVHTGLFTCYPSEGRLFGRRFCEPVSCCLPANSRSFYALEWMALPGKLQHIHWVSPSLQRVVI